MQGAADAHFKLCVRSARESAPTRSSPGILRLESELNDDDMLDRRIVYRNRKTTRARAHDMANIQDLNFRKRLPIPSYSVMAPSWNCYSSGHDDQLLFLNVILVFKRKDETGAKN